MMWMHKGKQFSQLKSVCVFPAYSRGKEPMEMKANIMMFCRQAMVGIMPITGIQSVPLGFSAKIVGNGGEQARATLIVSSVSRSSHGNNSDMICSAVNQIAQFLAARGRLVHEILPEVGGDSYCLCSFTSQRLFRVPGWYIQLVPREDRHWEGRPPVVFLHSRDVWEISMPPELGGARGHAYFLRQLGRRQPTGPKFFQQGLEKQNLPKHLNLSEYRRAEQVRIWRVANKWGWVYGGTSRCTEFFHMHRIIRHEWALAVLRDHIIHELNALLTRLGIRAKIVVEGLSSPKEILAISEKMGKCEMTFAQAWEAAKKRKLPPI